MNDLLQTIDAKKQTLDRYRPLPPELVKNLDDWCIYLEALEPPDADG